MSSGKNSELYGRLLTPEEGCGFSEVTNLSDSLSSNSSQIISGTPAQNGKLKYDQIF